jgi:hypothetical protein
MLRVFNTKCSDIGHDLPPFLFRQHRRDELLHTGAWTAVFNNPKQFPILPVFLKGTVREISWRMGGMHMGSWTVAFTADPVTEITPPFAFVERFTRCDDFRRGCASLSKGGLIAESLLRRPLSLERPRRWMGARSSLKAFGSASKHLLPFASLTTLS